MPPQASQWRLCGPRFASSGFLLVSLGEVACCSKPLWDWLPVDANDCVLTLVHDHVSAAAVGAEEHEPHVIAASSRTACCYPATVRRPRWVPHVGAWDRVVVRAVRPTDCEAVIGTFQHVPLGEDEPAAVG